MMLGKLHSLTPTWRGQRKRVFGAFVSEWVPAALSYTRMTATATEYKAVSRTGFPGSLPAKQKQRNTANSRFRGKQTCLKNLRGDQPQASSQGQISTGSHPREMGGRTGRSQDRKLGLLASPTTEASELTPERRRRFSLPRHPDQGRGKFLTGPMPGAAEGKAKGSGGPALRTLGYLASTPSLLSSLGSGQQQDSVWEPGDPVIPLRPLCWLPLFSVGFERFICCCFPESDRREEELFHGQYNSLLLGG